MEEEEKSGARASDSLQRLSPTGASQRERAARPGLPPRLCGGGGEQSLQSGLGAREGQEGQAPGAGSELGVLGGGRGRPGAGRGPVAGQHAAP